MSLLPSLPVARARPGDKRSMLQRATAMCALVAEGKSLRAAAKAEGLSHSAFLAEVGRNAELRAAYETAREAGIEADISQLETEADKVMRVAKAMSAKSESAGAYVAAFGHKVNIVKWRAEKQLPKKYGPKVDHMLSGSGAGGAILLQVTPTDEAL